MMLIHLVLGWTKDVKLTLHNQQKKKKKVMKSLILTNTPEQYNLLRQKESQRRERSLGTDPRTNERLHLKQGLEGLSR